MHVKSALFAVALYEISLNGNNVPCTGGEQDGSHHDKFKFVTNAKCTVFMQGDSNQLPGVQARFLTAAVAKTSANVDFTGQK